MEKGKAIQREGERCKGRKRDMKYGERKCDIVKGRGGLRAGGRYRETKKNMERGRAISRKEEGYAEKEKRKSMHRERKQRV